MSFKKSFSLLAALAAVGFLGMGASPARADLVFVGSYWVGDGPLWTDNPVCYTAQEAAALIFGGSPSDYAISTDPNTVNYLAWVDGWGDTRHLKRDWHNSDGDGDYMGTPVAQDYKLQIGTGYNDPYGGPAFSAYVADHDFFYVTSEEEKSINYVFRMNGAVVPEPGAVALLAGLMTLSGGLYLRRRKR